MIYDVEQQVANLESDTKNANVIKEMILKQLLNDNHIAETVYSEYSTHWNIIITKRSWFKQLFALKKIKDDWVYSYIKLFNY